ncbi:MAG TPA: signal peptidase II [Burkholderiaceae bacterium]|nr:signal peptidase II [Burkholderiaceae bacterium]
MAWGKSASAGRNLAPWLGVAAIVILADQYTKLVIAKAFSLGETRPVTSFFSLVLAYNRGAAFSMFDNAGGWQSKALLGVGVAASLFILYLLARHGSQRLFGCALALILGGALGNVVDRVVHGHVIDFLLFHWRDWYFPAFNVADSAISVGAALLILDELLRVRRSR